MGDCFLIGHGGYVLPKLDSNYPKDVILTSYNAEAVFQVKIAKNGRPKKYTYKWYFSEDEGKTFKEVSSGQDKDTLLISGYNGEQAYQVYCEVSNKKGTIKSRVAKMTIAADYPLFTYVIDGTDQSANQQYVIKEQWETSNWKLKFLQSGTLTFLNRGKARDGIDAFLVGGGGGGGAGLLSTHSFGGGGGGGGRSLTTKNIPISIGTSYSITIGAGGEAGTNRAAGGSGGTTSAFGQTAQGGSGGGVGEYWSGAADGGAGGSGGGGGAMGGYTKSEYESDGRDEWQTTPGNGGSNGSNGKGDHTSHNMSTGSGGAGKDSSTGTREFWENTGALYAGGGAGGGAISIDHSASEMLQGTGGDGGGGNSGLPGTANTGGGGGGGYSYIDDRDGAKGGSGIVVIRNHQ